MYRQRAFNVGWRTLFFALVIYNFYQPTLSASSICTNQRKGASVVEGQNVSIDFHLERRLLKNEYLVWKKQANTWNLTCTHKLVCSGLNHERYKLIITHNKIMKILIEHAQKSDMGSHIINVYSGSRPDCVILNLTLTVTDPPSPTKFLRNKMSCRFVQNTEEEPMNVPLTEKVKSELNQISNMSLDNAVCNSADNFTVYLDFQEIFFVTQNSSTVCGVSKRNEIENMIKSCKFDSLEEPIILNDETRIVFERCNGNGETHQKWWYMSIWGHELLPLPQKYQFHDNNAEFICESYPSSKGHNKARLNLREHKTTCTSAFEEAVYSTTFSNCTTLILNVLTDLPSTVNLISTSSTKSRESTNPILPTAAEKKILIYVASISIIALVFSIASCFFKCKFISGRGNLSNHLLNSQAVRHIGDTEPVQTIAFVPSQNTSQLVSKETWIQSDTPNQASVIDKGKHDHGQEREPSSSECQSKALKLRTRPAMVKHHNLHDTLNDMGKPSTSTDESHIGTSYPPCMDSSYHSSDDVKDISGNREQLSSTPPPLPCSLSSSNERRTRCEGNDSLDVEEVPSCLVKPKIRGEGTLGSASKVRSDVKALYAKPDMSRKTKKSISRSVPLESGRLEMTISDQDYDDVRNPMDIESAIVNTTRKSEPIYESCD